MGKQTVSNTLMGLQTTNSLKNLNYFLQYQPRCLPDQTRPITMPLALPLSTQQSMPPPRPRQTPAPILSMTRASQRATKSSSSMPNRVQLFPKSPKYDCWWAYSVWEHGVGQSGNL